jgi:hypothetical protein
MSHGNISRMNIYTHTRLACMDNATALTHMANEAQALHHTRTVGFRLSVSISCAWLLYLQLLLSWLYAAHFSVHNCGHLKPSCMGISNQSYNFFQSFNQTINGVIRRPQSHMADRKTRMSSGDIKHQGGY